MARRTFLGTLRLALLIAVLVFVALGAWLDRERSTCWDRPLRVTIYPVTGDGEAGTAECTARVDASAFDDATGFLSAQSRAYGLTLDEPTHILVSHAAPDSTGLRKGLVAVAHVFCGASAVAGNAMVVTHELRHTLGATDKYDLATGQPLVPQGLGAPAQAPLYPQKAGEIMAGRIAEGPRVAVIPDSLAQMRVGPDTAREIGWLR